MVVNQTESLGDNLQCSEYLDAQRVCLKHTVKGVSSGSFTLNDNASDAVGVLPGFPKVQCHS